MTGTNGDIKNKLRKGELISEADAIKILREIVDEDYGGIRPLSRAWNLSAPYISDVLRGQRNIGPSILKKLGLIRVPIKPPRPKYRAAHAGTAS